MGTQKNRLNETVLLITQNICKKLWERKYLQFYSENFCLLRLKVCKLMPLCIEKMQCKKLDILMFKQCSQVDFGLNQVDYARIQITQVSFVAISLACGHLREV